MPGEIEAVIVKLFFSALALLKGAAIPAVPVYVLALLGLRARDTIGREMKWKWTASTLAVTFMLCWGAALLAYFYPLVLAAQEQGLGLLPPGIAPSQETLAASFIYGIFKVTLVAALAALLLLPLEFIGSYIHSVVREKLPKIPGSAQLLVSAYLTTLAGSFIVLFIVPQSVTGILYLLYYGFPA